MTVRHTVLGSMLAVIGLLPIAAQAQRYYDYRAPTIVYESPAPVEEHVIRYWDSSRGVWVEQRVVDEPRSMHWVPEQRVVQPDGSILIQNGHWEYDR